MASSVVVDNTPLFLDEDSYSGSQLSAPLSQTFHGEGVSGAQDFKVTFSSGLGVNVAAGVARVRGKNVSAQGLRKVTSTASVLLTMDAADAQPRIDTIVLRVYDDVNDASGQTYATVEILKGSAQSGATLDNPLGAVAPSSLPGSKSVVILAYCQINASNSPAFSGTYIADRRPMGVYGTIPPLLGNPSSDIVSLIPHPGLLAQATQCRADATIYAGFQSAALMWLPRDITGCTTLRWSYQTGDGTNGSAGRITGGNYLFTVCDGMGRKIVQTPSAPFSTTAGDNVVAVESLNSTTDFYTGYYYVWWGVNTAFAGGSVYLPGVKLDSNWNNGVGGQLGMRTGLPNMAFRANTGGVNFGSSPNLNTVLYMSGVGTAPANTNTLPVPLVSFSKG